MPEETTNTQAQVPQEPTPNPAPEIPQEYVDPNPPTPKKKCSVCKLMFIVGLLLVLGGVAYYVVNFMLMQKGDAPKMEVTDTMEKVDKMEESSGAAAQDAGKPVDTVTDELITEIDSISSESIDADFNETNLSDL